MLSQDKGLQIRYSGLAGNQLGKVSVLSFETAYTAAQLFKLDFEPISSGLLGFGFALPNLGRCVIRI
ncbi:hypothetical protein AB0D13_09055 [Streptomyces sp. NPDC048430]|uniref:hypothetical protein n=1 Tax=Streptomyces sp. NPDC048430 TaxID=3155388 RepID=UPI003444839B